MISVVIATYNGEKYISKQLRSILNQTYSDFEIVIVDDCSSDRTADLINSVFEKADFQNYRIIINEKNLGHNKSFEKAIGYCAGDYIAISDQDDIWMENKLEKLMERIIDNETDLVFSQSLIIKGERHTRKKYPKQDNSKDFFVRLQHNNARGASMMIRKSFLQSILPFSNADIYDKWIYFISILMGSVSFNAVPLDYYRVHSENVVGTEFKYSPKSKVMLKLKSKVRFYNDLTLFLENQNYTNKEVFISINSIIEFYESMRRCLESKSSSCLKSYVKFVLLKDFFIKEKLIFLYYYLIKKK